MATSMISSAWPSGSLSVTRPLVMNAASRSAGMVLKLGSNALTAASLSEVWHAMVQGVDDYYQPKTGNSSLANHQSAHHEHFLDY